MPPENVPRQAVQHRLELHRLDRGGDPRGTLAPRHAGHAGVEVEVLGRRQPAVGRQRLRHVADRGAHGQGVGADVLARDRRRPRVGRSSVVSTRSVVVLPAPFGPAARRPRRARSPTRRRRPPPPRRSGRRARKRRPRSRDAVPAGVRVAAGAARCSSASNVLELLAAPPHVRQQRVRVRERLGQDPVPLGRGRRSHATRAGAPRARPRLPSPRATRPARARADP